MAKEKVEYKFTGVSQIYSRINKDGYEDFYVRLNYLGVRYSQVNYSTLFGTLTLDDTKDQLDYVKGALKQDNKYLVQERRDELTNIKTTKKEVINLEEQLIFHSQFMDYFNNNEALQKTTQSTIDLKLMNYNNHLKPIIGAMSVKEITEKDLRVIFLTMAKKNLSLETQIKVKVLINQILEPLAIKRIIVYNPMRFTDLQEPKGYEAFKPLNERLNLKTFEDYIDVSRKIYKAIPKVIKNEPTQAFFYMSLLTVRRRSELWKVNKKLHIVDNLITADKKMTKTKIQEDYYIPQEVMDLMKFYKKDFPFKIGDATVYRNWQKIKKEIGMENLDIRSYDTRHLLMSIMPLQNNYFTPFDENLVGACLSHHGGDNSTKKSNRNYRSYPLESRNKVFETYWEMIRGNLEDKQEVNTN